MRAAPRVLGDGRARTDRSDRRGDGAWARPVFALCAGALLSCAATATRTRAPSVHARRTADSGVASEPPSDEPRWSIVAVSLFERESAPRAIEAADAVERWVFGGLRAKADGADLSIVGEALRAPIVAATPIDPLRSDGEWLFVSEDGAAWLSRSFDGPLERVARESAMRLGAAGPRSSGTLALFGRDRTLFFADREGLRRAPEALEEPVITAAFESRERGFVLEAPGRLLETTDAGRTFRRRSLARSGALDESVLSMELGATSLTVRTARGWLELQATGVQPAAQRPVSLARTTRASDRARFARAALFEPGRGRALALTLGATLLRDGTLALVDRPANSPAGNNSDDATSAEIVLVPTDRGATRVEAPCDNPALHPFGERVIVECSSADAHDDRARYFVSSTRGFEPLGRSATRALSAIETSRVHIASDGSGVLIEAACDELYDDASRGPDSNASLRESDEGHWCVLDGHHSPRSRVAPPEARVLAIAAGRVLFDLGARALTRRAPIGALHVTELARDTDIELPSSLSVRDATLAPDGAIVATWFHGPQRSLVRIEPGRAPVVRALPGSADRVVVIDATRVIAVGYAPLRAWLSDDHGQRWTTLATGIDGASSAPDEHDRERHAQRPRWLGAAETAPPACGPFACDLGDGLVFAERRWLRAPPLRAATAVGDAVVRERDPRFARDGRAQLRPPEQVWFCGSAQPRDPRAAFMGRNPRSATLRASPQSDVFGSPGARGWLDVETDGARVRARWLALDRAQVLRGASLPTSLAPLAPSPSAAVTPPQSAAPPITRLRLATRAFAVIERCAPTASLGASDAQCDLLFASHAGALRSLGVVGDWLSGERWTGRLHAVEALDDGGFAVWITRPDPTVDTDSVAHEDGADALVVFDGRGRSRGSRVYAWAPRQWALRGLAWDGTEAGIAGVDPRGALRFFALSGQRDGRELASRFTAESGPCASAQGRPSRWLITSERGWTPFVYARGRAAPIELGARARWSLATEVACVEELRVDPVDDRPSALQRALDAALVVRAARDEQGHPTLEATFVAGTTALRERCIPR